MFYTPFFKWPVQYLHIPLNILVIYILPTFILEIPLL
nr:MAG TPA: Movement and RNA silencing protein [Caudoviricetes sp.]